MVGQSRYALRYQAKDAPSDEPELLKAIYALVRAHPRYGYRHVCDQLRLAGWHVNRKRIHRLWKREGFRVPVRRRKLRGKGEAKNGIMKQPARFPNDVWAWDFVHDVDVRGRTLRFLVMVDEFTRELLILEPRRCFPASAAQELLREVIRKRGFPKKLRSDNGGEFTEAQLLAFLNGSETTPLPIEPGSPWQNGFSESTNSRVRDEFLEMNDFLDIWDARAKAHAFRKEWNEYRCHSSIGRIPPLQFAKEWKKRHDGQGASPLEPQDFPNGADPDGGRFRKAKKTTRVGGLPSVISTGAALRLRPRRALSSAPTNTVYNHRKKVGRVVAFSSPDSHRKWD